MKYIVDLNGHRHEVLLGAGGIIVDGEAVAAHLAEIAGAPLCIVTLDGAAHPVRVRRGDTRGSYTLWIDGYRFDGEALDERTRAIRDLAVEKSGEKGPAPLVAPMPGLVVRVLASEGQVVQQGDGLVVVEAMKMENELRASSPGRVKTVHARPGEPVEKGALLIELEAVDA